ncbi:MAG: diguanylate cyclase domain-containing protein [Pseudomonadota bacterium]
MVHSFRYTTGFGFLLLLLLIGVLGAFGITQLRAVQESLQTVVTEQNRKVNLVTDMQVYGYHRSDSLYSMVLLKDPFERDEVYMQRYNPAGFEVGNVRVAYQNLGLSTEEQEIFDRQTVLVEEVVELQDRMVDLLNADEYEQARVLMLERVMPLQEAINLTFDEFRQIQKAANRKAMDEAEQAYLFTRNVFMAIGFGIMVLGVVIALAVYRKTENQAKTIDANMRELEKSHRQLEYVAHHDTLTGLPNRAYFNKMFIEAIKDSAVISQPMAILYLDLDQFKQVNDTLGHHAGDRLLKLAAERIKGCLRSSDLLARLGGDEFVAVLKKADTGVAKLVAGKIVDTLNEPFVIDGKEAQVGTSIGISVYPVHGDEDEALIRCADNAMYQAKSEGRSGYRLTECLAAG